MSKARHLRHCLSENPPVIAVGGHDGLSAKLAERAGFGAVWASGLEISTSAALPDANILTMTDFLRAAREMNSATSLPIIADCDTGFGNSNNVIHMIRQYEVSGIAAVCIEDKLFPKVNSFVPGRQELATPWEFAGKLMAAKHAQETGDLVVIARLESLIAGHGLEDALRRADTYHRAGADMILIHSKAKTADPVLEFLARWKRQSPVAIVPTTYPELTIDDWQSQGVNLIIYANHGLRASIKAVEDVYSQILSQRTTRNVEDSIAPLSTVFELQGMPAMKLEEQRFLKNLPGSDVRAVILAGGTVSPGDLEEKLGGTVEKPLLDVYGRTVLQRQISTLYKVGVKDVALVSSIPPEKVKESGSVKAIPAPVDGGLMDTIVAGLNSDSDCDRTLLCYSDVLFEPPALEALLGETSDISLLVDRSFQETQAFPRKSSLDFLTTNPEPPSDVRALQSPESYKVQNISKSMSISESHFEFIGLLQLTLRGVDIFLKKYQEYSSEPTAQKLSLNDFLRRLISDGVEINAREVRRGWLEIHDFQDYKTAIEQVKAR